MLIIPLNPVPAQTLTAQLDGQPTRIDVLQKATGIFLNLYVNDVAIITGVICQDANRIVRDAYLGFIGDLAFYDTQGDADPYYTGLGSRWVLAYLEVADLS